MARLSGYLVRLFWSEAGALFAVAGFLLFLFQCLKLFDLVTDQGQSLLSLVGLALLGLPALGILLLYVCFGIGLGRGLRSLAASSELAVIHVHRMVPALLRAIAIYTVSAAAVVLLLSHIVEPLTNRATYDWTVKMAADLVSQAMVPHRFTTLASGVTVVIGERDGAGNISDFFADDHRSPAQRRTYFAKSALITQDPQGYVLRMRDGAVQYLTAENRFSQVSFTRYDLPLDNLTGATIGRDLVSQTTTPQLLAAGPLDDAALNTLWRRTSEGFRVLAICLFISAFTIFPTGRRGGGRVPAEMTVLGAAFVERTLTSYLPGGAAVPFGIGSLILAIVGIVVLLVKLRVFRPARIPRLAA